KPGVIFCFRQTSDFDTTNNSIALYIGLYLTDEGEVHLHYTNAKKILDYYRRLSLVLKEPSTNLVNHFNEETNDGENMHQYINFLRESIDIVKDKTESDAFDSLFSPGGTSMQTKMDLDFDELELISFLIIKGEV